MSSLRSSGGASRAILRLCLSGELTPLMGEKLFREFEDILSRSDLFERSMLTAEEREELADALFSVSKWVETFFLWRPNLPDEGDNHLVELAIAGGATSIVTHNVRDLRGGELRFPQVIVETPAEFLKRRR